MISKFENLLIANYIIILKQLYPDTFSVNIQVNYNLKSSFIGMLKPFNTTDEIFSSAS